MRFSTALGPNGQLIVDLIPELKLIIGEQPPAPELPPQDAQRRFQLVLRRFIGVFARPEHPLALFLDDLQWLDAATLDLLEDLLTQPDVHHLLLIGAYRDNEVNAHASADAQARGDPPGGRTGTGYRLDAARPDDLEPVVADSLHCDPSAPTPGAAGAREDRRQSILRHPVSVRAGRGRPSRFRPDAARWTWDLRRIHAKGYTDNVVDLMLGKLSRLPAATRAVLQRLACLGNSATIATLALSKAGPRMPCTGPFGRRYGPGSCCGRRGPTSFCLHGRAAGGGLCVDPGLRAGGGTPRHRSAARLAFLARADERGPAVELADDLEDVSSITRCRVRETSCRPMARWAAARSESGINA